jgi:hypothetical protein
MNVGESGLLGFLFGKWSNPNGCDAAQAVVVQPPPNQGDN